MYQNCAIEQLLLQQSNSVVPMNLTNSLLRSKMDMINQEISELDQRMQNIQLVKIEKSDSPPGSPRSDLEHIYETIPEAVDSELEPIYSCPYECQEDNMVEQWLKAQGPAWSPQGKKQKKKGTSKSSKSNSSGEEHENSSSAYNTGGSSNSNPLTVELACSGDPRQKDVCR